MLAVDTNVLVFAHRGETPAHAVAMRRLVELAESTVPWVLPVFCLSEFLRVVTHLRVFTPPSPLNQALDFIDGLLASPSVRVLHPSQRYVELLGEVCRAVDARGNLVFDAQIVALCAEHGVDRILTADRDFLRFSSYLSPEFLA